MKKYDVNGLNNEEYIRSDFVSKVDKLCEAVECEAVGVKDCEKLVQILEEAATATLPEVIKSA